MLLEKDFFVQRVLFISLNQSQNESLLDYAVLNVHNIHPCRTTHMYTNARAHTYVNFFPGTEPLYKRLKKSAIPHIFFWSKQPTPSAVNRSGRARKRLELEKEANEKRDMAVNDVGAEETVASSDDILTGTFYVHW